MLHAVEKFKGQHPIHPLQTSIRKDIDRDSRDFMAQVYDVVD